MADAIEKLKKEIQAELPDAWQVFHVRPYVRPDWQDQMGEYRAQRRLENGALIVQHGDTPEGLVRATKEYDRDHARAVTVTPTPVAGTVATPTPTPLERAAEFRPDTEEELASMAIDVQPVALAEKLAVDPDFVEVTDETKQAAGLTAKGTPKKGTEASIIPPGASPEQAATVTGVQPKKTSRKKAK